MAVAESGLMICGTGRISAGVTTRSSVFMPVPPGLVALRMTVKVPSWDGVPLMSPVLVLRVNPKGSPEASKLVGLFVAVI